MRHLYFFLYLLLLVTLPALSASPPWYEVEIVVFEHLAPQTKDLEIRSKETRPLNLENTQNPPPGRGNTPAQETGVDSLPLAPRAWKLMDIGQHLNKSSHYRLLLHQAWRQVAVSPQQAQPISLHLPLDNALDGPPDPQLKGTITLSRGRFLHLSLDLLYQDPAATASLESNSDIAPINPSHHFRLTESRRVRIQELHYFDHPRFGVLAQVRQSATPAENAPNVPETFPLETTSAQEIPPKETSEGFTPKE